MSDRGTENTAQQEAKKMAGNELSGAVIAVAGGRTRRPGGTAATRERAPPWSARQRPRAAGGGRTPRVTPGGAAVTGETVDLLDLDSTRDWALRTEKEPRPRRRAGPFVGGWRGSETFTKTSLDDWDFLELLLIRTVQHTSLAFFEPLQRSERGRYLLISAAGASKPTAGNACTPPPRPPPRRGRSRWPTPSARPGAPRSWTSAAAILVVKALVHDAMRADRPNAKFAGFTTSRTWPRPSSASGTSPPPK